jgi:hypothetical protein
VPNDGRMTEKYSIITFQYTSVIEKQKLRLMDMLHVISDKQAAKNVNENILNMLN